MVSLVLLLFVGQTMIFLLRLVAADRRSRRRPLSGTARKTVGQLEEEAQRDAGDEGAPTRDEAAPTGAGLGPTGEDGTAAGDERAASEQDDARAG